MTNEDAVDPRPLVLVLVGTDHHRFDRLVGWVDGWAAAHQDRARVVVQHGTASPPAAAQGRAMLGHDELVALVAEAAVVVTHGGPATIADVRRSGRRPLVVPRDPARDEHVDGHQQRFARRLAADGLVELCETAELLERSLGACLADPHRIQVDPDDDRARVARAVTAVGTVLAGLTVEDRRPRWWTARRTGRRDPGPTR